MEEAQQVDTTTQNGAPPSPTQPETQEQTTPLTLSPTSSPTHEFSFTISLHSATTTTPSSPKHHKSPSSAIDLTPADDIFFHGHLLPLHFLSHLHASSPRSSTNSRDSFTVPAKPAISSFPQDRPKTRPNKPNKAFSLSGFAKWIKGSSSETKEKPGKSKKVKFDVAHFLKRYLKLVKTRSRQQQQHHQSYSFSGSLSPRISKRELRSLRGEFSAPSSMRTSPTNSGRLVPSSGVPSPVSESTMEELHAAIQAAIAHCKKSTATTSAQQATHGLSTSPVTVN